MATIDSDSEANSSSDDEYYDNFSKYKEAKKSAANLQKPSKIKGLASVGNSQISQSDEQIAHVEESSLITLDDKGTSAILSSK